MAESNFEEAQPLEIELGDGTFPQPLEYCLLGLRAGQTDSRELAPTQAWGPHDPDNHGTVALAQFPDDMQPVPGQIIAFELPPDGEVLGTVTTVSGDSAEVDFNHPLAGHSVRFDVEIVSVTPPAG